MAAAIASLTAFVTSWAMLGFYKNDFERKGYSIPPEQLKELIGAWSSLYNLPQDNPARFALNELAGSSSLRAFHLLCGGTGSVEDREQAAETLRKLRKKINVGLKWPYKTPPSFKIPHAKTAPEIDGNLNDSCWKHALSFKGSYPLDSVKKEVDGSIWKMMWDKKYLYIGAYFPDTHIIASDRPGHPFQGDSLEIFIMPSKRMKKYWEVVVGCSGDLFDGFQCNNRNGGWAPGPDAEMKGLKFKVLTHKNTFSIEAAVPFSELPNYMLANQPRAGEVIHFALVRANKNKKCGEVKFSSATPLLYGGHNIFGHAKGVLK